VITVIALKPANQTSSVPDRNKLSLDDQVRLACWGHNINDVGAIALNLVLHVLVQTTNTKDQALQLCDRTMKELREIIERDYEQIHKEINEVKEH
jgi:ketopantoate reductase